MIDLCLGDCLDIMRGMETESVDAVVTDPPYGLSFMGKDWDHGVPGIHFWSEALRVAKPGAYLLAFGGTRTYHRLVCAIEDAGFEIRDTIEWVYGSGFPKSLDVSKAIDKAAGAERRVIGKKSIAYPDSDCWGEPNKNIDVGGFGQNTNDYGSDVDEWSVKNNPITAPATDAAREWSGWGTALKPAHEPIVVARKPLSEATVAANVLRWGTGALNIDASRIGTETRTNSKSDEAARGNGILGRFGGMDTQIHNYGRFPANLITDGSAEVVAMFPQSKDGTTHGWNASSGSVYGNGKGLISQDKGNVQFSYGGGGSAARFFKSCPLDEDDYPPLFYCAKASKAERDAGCEGIPLQKRSGKIMHNANNTSEQASKGFERFEPEPMRNGHPTVKPLSLMRYLITLCTREGAMVLDPFMGSGTTGIACVQLGRNFIGCDNVEKYVEIAKRRIEAAQPVAIELPLMAEA